MVGIHGGMPVRSYTWARTVVEFSCSFCFSVHLSISVSLSREVSRSRVSSLILLTFLNDGEVKLSIFISPMI